MTPAMSTLTFSPRCSINNVSVCRPCSRYVPTCQVGDIVIVRAFREEYNGFKGKVLAVLTGDVKVEMLEGPTVGNTKKQRRSSNSPR